jgi:MFS family permease
VSSVITLVGAALQAGAVNIAMFIVGRIIVGMGMAVAVVATPTYVVEVAKSTYRGFALGLYYSCWNVGTLMASGICYGVSYSL